MAFEALTYERMSTYENELPPDIETWQPQKIMELLLSIDPYSDQNCTVRFAPEDQEGRPIEPFKTLGHERRVSLVEIRKHYHALGSFLHAPTPRNLKANKVDPDIIRERCKIAATVIDDALKSSMWKLSFGTTLKATCNRCGRDMPRRVSFIEVGEIEHSCFYCKASHRFLKSEESWRYTSNVTLVDCLKTDCNHQLEIWADQLRPDYSVVCSKCGTAHEFALGLRVAKP